MMSIMESTNFPYVYPPIPRFFPTVNRFCLKHFCTAFLASVLWFAPIHDSSDALAASAQQKAAQEKKRVEGQRANIEQKLQSLQAELDAREARSEETSLALKNADQAISLANRKLRDLREEKRGVEDELAKLRKSGSNVATNLKNAENTVAQIAKAQYINSRRSHWQNLIGGINPSTLASDKGKLNYLAHAQQVAIADLEERQNNIRNLSEKHLNQHRELARIQLEEEKERKSLLKEKQERQLAYGKLQSEIKSHQARIDKLKKDQARLSSLVAAIDARLEKERRLEEEAAKKQALRRPTKNQNTAYTPLVGSFGKLKGRLNRPVKGTVVGRFGTERQDQAGATWQGMQFRAPEGSEVSACAAGKVVFSDWLRGFGNLIIIDHGNTYMSIYGNNESIFKNVGDTVKQGETISSVGISGGLGEPGLYFELRYKGKPINPQPWLKP